MNRFIPQFSLRTLLLVTALIAVGAKLWHGPYHFVETINGVEYEYDYYRGWSLERVKHGAVIKRYPVMDGSSQILNFCDKGIEINVWRHGQDTYHLCRLLAYRSIDDTNKGTAIFALLGVRAIITEKLSEQENQQLHAAICKESELLKQQGYEHVIEDLRSNNSVKQLPDNIEPEPTPDTAPKGDLF
jgi:hypothetical protein